MITSIPSFLLTAVIAGVLGGVAMECVLWLVGAAGWAKANMVVALGSLFTKSRDSGWRVGIILHVIAAIGFAIIYTYAIVSSGYTHLPGPIVLGAMIGFIHGLIVSLGLVWVVAERHPLEEFNEAGLAIGLSHILGHVAYGIIVGIVVTISPL